MKIILKILAVVGLFILLASSFTLLALAESSIEENVYLDSDGVRLSPGRIGMLAVITEVNTFNDDQIDNSNCTLREAIQAANNDAVVDQCSAGSGDDTIILSTGTYTLTEGDLTISSTLTISGAGATNTIIKSDGSSRVFDIDSTGVVTISGVTITNGKTDQGGGILNSGTLNLNNSTVISNIATNGSELNLGGGILNQNILILNNTTVTSNTADYDGGGIYNQDGVLTVSDSTISYNTANGDGGPQSGVGGGIANAAESANAILTINGSMITTNTVEGVGGGGISNSAKANRTATTTLSQTIVSSNVATATVVTSTTGFGGGIRNSFFTGANNNSEAILSLYDSTVQGNTAFNGGGIANGTLTDRKTLSVYLENSTVSGNTANGFGSDGTVGNGGGLLNQNGTMTLVNSTVSDNTATGGTGLVRELGGGIANSSFNITTTLWLTNTTIASNTATSGDGVANVKGLADTIANFKNSIVAGGCYNQSGTLTSLGYNLEDGNTCNLTATGDITNTNPSLGLLADNGGDTETHALLSSSPAIDSGGKCSGAAPPTDQRGEARPNAITPFCDIGAYESNLRGVVDLQITKTVTPNEAVPGQTITYTLTFVNNGRAGASGVVITDAVPVTLTNVISASSGATITPTAGFTYSWTVADLLAGKGGTITITGKIVSPTVSGAFFNTAIITTTINNPDSNLASNNSSISVTVNAGSPGPGPGGIYLPIVLKNS